MLAGQIPLPGQILFLRKLKSRRYAALAQPGGTTGLFNIDSPAGQNSYDIILTDGFKAPADSATIWSPL